MVKLKMSGNRSKPQGQAMVEYALILVLLALAFGVTLAATGPAIGNVFCNVVHNIGGSTADPQGGNCGSTAPDLVDEGGNPPLFWQTVTWVAGHPQTETPFPTPIHRAPTSVGAGLPDTSTPTPTNTNTQTPTQTNTPTQTYTPSPGPSPTVSDFAFTVPFVDQMNNVNDWRLDTGTLINPGASWTANYYSTVTSGGGTPAALTFSGLVSTNTNVATGPGLTYSSSGVPGGISGSSTTWGIDFTMPVSIVKTGSYQFSLTTITRGNIEVFLDSTAVAWNASATGIINVTTAGAHTLEVKFQRNAGTSASTYAVTMAVTRLSIDGTDTNTTANAACHWGQNSSPASAGIAGSNAVSPTFQFEDYPGQTSWPGSQTCDLELRGYVDLGANAHPILSFWDIWDFANASNVTAELDIAKYTTDASGNPAPTGWTAVATRNQTANYAWTRSQVDLSQYIATLGTKVTFRFRLGSNAAQGGPFRWYIDDIQIVNDAAPSTTFTVNKSWNLNSRSQMSDFIYDGDSFDNPGLGSPSTTRRWDLTSTHAHTGMAWDDSPTNTSNSTGKYQDLNSIGAPTGTGNARVHYLEFKYPIDVTTANAPNPDSNGNTGNPLLSFWEAYDIAMNASIRVQYTRDSNDPSENLSAGGIESWTDVPNGVLVDYTTVPSGASRTNLAMQQVQIDLSGIPNWQTQPFRLRFALYVDNAAASFGDGWYIDDIALQRQNGSPYFAYPFVDDAENPAYTASTWDAIGGLWGATTEKGGALNTATAYSDSPQIGGVQQAYTLNAVQMLQMHYAIDLLHDTPANTTDTPGRAAAVNPMLTFWMLRQINSNAKLTVDLWTAYNNTWSTVWTYDGSNATYNAYNTQNAWERVEINLPDAIQAATSRTWAQVTGADGITNDDDIKLRFDLQVGSSGSSADGVYVDQISVQDSSTLVDNLSNTNTGSYTYNGAYVDGIEFAAPIGGSWYNRWYAGGQWGTTSAAGFEHSGSLALSPTTSASFPANTFSVLELIPIIDMTNTPNNIPTLYFWTRFSINNNASLQVQVAQEDTSSGGGGNNYDKIGGWSAWTSQTIMAGVPYSTSPNYLTNDGVNTWQRAQVNLTSFIGHRIRVRFVMRVPGTAQAGNLAIDDVAFTYTRTQDPLPFTDNAQTLANWVTEGTWGLASNYFVGAGTSSSDFGPTNWSGTYFDCEALGGFTNAACTGSGTVASTYDTILKNNANLAAAATFNSTDPTQPVGPESVTDINFNWGSSGLPLNGSAPSAFLTTYTARWTRQVHLSAGTYNFSTIADDGVRLWIDDYTGTNIPAGATVSDGGVNARYIINDWGKQASAAVDFGTFTVTSPIDRTLTLEYFRTTGNAEIILNASGSSYSFTDSPNTYTGCTSGAGCVAGFQTVTSVQPGNSSLMLSGYFNFTSSTTPSLDYQRYYDLTANTKFYVETSTDGGFTWSQLGGETLTGATTRLPTSGAQWDQRAVSLSSVAGQANVIIRFRLDTRTAASTGDGVYIAAVQVNP